MRIFGSKKSLANEDSRLAHEDSRLAHEYSGQLRGQGYFVGLGSQKLALPTKSSWARQFLRFGSRVSAIGFLP